jgi:hypothetical protein
MMRSLSFVAVVAALAGSSHASVITDWNSLLMNAIRQEPAGPPTMARGGAMVMSAMYNAVNAVDQTHFAYGGFNVVAAPDTSREAAAAQAAHDVMQNLYPSLGAQWTSALGTSLAATPDSPQKSAGILLGQQSASHCMALRSGDGTEIPPTYTAGPNPGDYRNPNPGDPNFAVDPLAGNFAQWGMTSGDQFRPTRLTDFGSMANLLASPEYTAQLNDVKANGRIDSWTPADEEYQIAFFWANDRNGTYKPPGHLNEITQTIANRQFAGLPADERLSKEARLFALVNMALADAGVAAWDAKFNTPIDLWRPIDGIRNADLDGNPDTISDPAWEPLNHVDPDGPGGPMLADPFTPPFPAYISGHATFGAAHAAIMREFFGDSDLIEGGDLTIGSEDPYNNGITRTFSSWEDMARENGRSRVFLGVHWQWDADDAYITGNSLGQWMFDNYLQPVPAPGALALLVPGVALAARRRRA